MAQLYFCGGALGWRSQDGKKRGATERALKKWFARFHTRPIVLLLDKTWDAQNYVVRRELMSGRSPN